ncbi:hypothetical protein [Flagellimonas sp. S3867]|uniref:hypothetical protein n=1 Tax=Flagellimonas sp. S3867 TaxID=2768063 RepID=UPI0016861F8C|nr:hypothetical protein [Flagellimonas sp. S3867]
MNTKNEDKIYLEELMIILQKSFSRVTDSTNKERSNKEDVNVPTAMLVGDVDYEIALKADPVGDKLLVHKNGSISFRFSGQIDIDLEEDKDVEKN